jgi:hypothetical protein
MSAQAKPDGLLAKYKLLGAVIDAEWSTALDHKIISHVIERYRSDHGNSRASLRYLAQATGAQTEKEMDARRNKIISSVRRLATHGVISVARAGGGTRPTEYALNFGFGTEISSGAQEVTSNQDSSGALQVTATGAQQVTSSLSSGALQVTESLLQEPVTRPVTERETPAGALDGLTPAAAPAGDKSEPRAGFDELWAAWGRKEKRADARHAYAKLAPDPELHSTLTAAATAWTAAYAAIDREKKFQKHLHTWLNDQCWEEDLPTAYETRTTKRTARAAKAQGNTDDDSGDAPTGRQTVEIVGSDAGDGFVSFSHRVRGGKHDGREFTHRIKLSDSTGGDLEGMETFRQLREATGIISPNDTGEFHGKVLCAIVSNAGSIRYEAGAAPARK